MSESGGVRGVRGVRIEGEEIVSTGWKNSRHSGVRYRSLRFDPETGAGAMILEMSARTSYPAHRHTQGEDVYVLEGELIVDAEQESGGARFGPGSYVYSPPGSVHSPRTDEGCTMFIVLPGRVEEIEGPGGRDTPA